MTPSEPGITYKINKRWIMLFSDVDITKEIENRQNNQEEGISIHPFEQKSLTPVGYDLRVGDRGFSWKNKKIVDIKQDGKIVIEPNDTVVIQTLESVSLSKKIGATVHSMVSRVITEGLSHISTTIDPGWTGKLYISIHNFRDVDIELNFTQTLCTVCFYDIKSESKVSLGRPPDRDDLWEDLMRRAKEERSRITREKRHQEAQESKIKTIKWAVGGFYIIIVILVWIWVSQENIELATSLAALLALINPVVYNFLFNHK
ncbi:MAG: dCTP deaminase [Planktothrix sp.]